MAAQRIPTSTPLSLWSVLAIVLAVHAGAPALLAQTMYNSTNVGFPETGIFHGGAVDTVQMANSNLHVEIPMWSTPGRGLNSGALYVYDSNQWWVKYVTNGLGVVNAYVMSEPNGTQGGVTNPTTAYFVSSQIQTFPHCTISFWFSNEIVREPNGTKHHMDPDPGPWGGGCPTSQPQTTWYADDGSGFTSTSTRDGTTFITGPGLEDTNGNELTASTDTLGRAVAYYDSSGPPPKASRLPAPASLPTPISALTSARITVTNSTAISMKSPLSCSPTA